MGLFFAGNSDAGRCALELLRSVGIPIDDRPGADTREILTDVPCFLQKEAARASVEKALAAASQNAVIYGGKLRDPLFNGLETVDFLEDPRYLALNAAITADCTLQLIGKTGDGPVLILGWGRIGKCLWLRLRDLGADVTVAARKDTDLAMAKALGCHTVPIGCLTDSLHHYKLILNTIPAAVLETAVLPVGSRKIDLASVKGLPGEDVLWARGLPGRYAPEASGKLIAETYLRLRKEHSLWK